MPMYRIHFALYGYMGQQFFSVFYILKITPFVRLWYQKANIFENMMFNDIQRLVVCLYTHTHITIHGLITLFRNTGNIYYSQIDESEWMNRMSHYKPRES